MLRSPACRGPPSGSGSGGMAGSRTAAQTRATSSVASSPYATGSATPSSKAARIRPAASGPRTAVAIAVVKFSVVAAGTSSAGTSRPTSAPRAGPADRERDRTQRHQGQQQHRAADAQQGLRQQPQHGDPEQHRAAQQHPAPVDGVGHRAAPQPENQQRYEGGDAEQPHPERVLRQRVHLHRYGDRGELEAEHRDAVAEPQPPVRRHPQRTQVDRPAALLARPGGLGRGHGASRWTTQPPSVRRKHSRSCSRLARPCQNSTDSGRTRSPPQCSGAGIGSTSANRSAAAR